MRRPALAFLLAAFLLAGPACSTSSTPTAPSTPSYAGAWAGSYTIADCTNVDAPGDTPLNLCASIQRTDSYRFTLLQTGNTVTGAYTLVSPLFTCACGGDYGTFDMSGTIASDGTLTSLATGVPRATGLTAAIIFTVRTASPSTLTGTLAGSVMLGDRQRARFIGTVSGT